VTLKELRRNVEAARALRNEYLSNLYGSETDFDQIDDRDFYPSNRYYTIKLFYDPAKFRTAAERRRLRGYLAEARAKYAKRSVELRPLNLVSLRYGGISLFPDMEELLVDRGYVLDVEGRDGKSSRRGHFLVVSHNINILRANAFYWSRMLLKAGISLDLWAKPPREKDKARLFAVMAPIVGMPTDPNPESSKAERLIPLVEHEQMLLGAKKVGERIAHIAHVTTPNTVVDHGRRQVQLLFSDRASLVQQQLTFELANSSKLFEGKSPVPNANSETNAAVLTWFSQVIAAQRKACWLVDAKNDWQLAVKQLLQEKELHKEDGLVQLPQKTEEARTWPELLQRELKGHAQNIESSTGQRPMAIYHELTWEDRILTALHGSTIEPEFGSHLVALAHWIGVLKRTGKQTLDSRIARCLRCGWVEIEAGQNCLLGQFPHDTWRVLVQRAESFFRPQKWKYKPGRLPYLDYSDFKEPKPIGIRYEWITRETLDSPLCEETKRQITLRGPMLCFPTHQLQYWILKAQTVRRQHGFMLRRAPS
jgi:hypothetical protein